MDSSNSSTAPYQPFLSDDVAITALVISLVALVVGLSQFLQAILGTAEGYRRCGSSVIGPWSKLRRRVFQWSEFRFETRYMVPSIALVSLQELDAADADCHKNLRGGEHVGHACDLGRIHGVIKKSSRVRNLLDAVKRFFGQRPNPTMVLLEALQLPELQRQDVASSQSLSRRSTQQNGFKREQSSQDDVKLERGVTNRSEPAKQIEIGRYRDTTNATWIRLTYELHTLYQDYQVQSLTNTRSIKGDRQQQDLSPAPEQLEHLYGDRPETTVVATPIVETWDFMPPDVSRPMALTTVGHMTVLALRLGMQWRLLDRPRLQMNADGNGFNISSTEVKGLGMAFRLSVFGRSHINHPIVPSHVTDKLMCGIVPGDPNLVMTDFSLIGQDRKLIQLWQPGSIYARLGLDETAIKILSEQNRWTTHNEVVTALCSFIPMRGAGVNSFFFSGWKTRQYSVFHFFECRLALLNALADHQEDLTPSRSMVLQCLALLARDFPGEFYDGCTSREPKEPDATKRGLDLVETCRTLFLQTTSYFDKNQFGQSNGSDKTWFMQLVAAHARLSAYVNQELDPSQIMSQKEILISRSALLQDAGVETTYFAEHLWQQMQKYIVGAENPDYGIVQYFAQRGFKGCQQSVIDAWWMLMLRGIVWDMSCKCLPFPGEPVPSSYYHDETTVWIT